MEKTRQESALETFTETTQDKENDVRTLKELELLLVGGGGDDLPSW